MSATSIYRNRGHGSGRDGARIEAGLRGFLGYVGNPNPDLSYSASVEYIGNLNSLNTPTGTVNSFGDNRLLMRAGVTWKIYQDIGVGLDAEARVDELAVHLAGDVGIPHVGKVIGLAARPEVAVLDLDEVADVHLGAQTRTGTLSMWKGMAGPQGARAGVQAAYMAREGMTGPDGVFEGKFGFWNQLMEGKAFDLPVPASFSNHTFAVRQTMIKSFPTRFNCQVPVFAAQKMFVIQSVINFFIHSGTGQAALTMPIMAPMAGSALSRVLKVCGGSWRKATISSE